MLVNCYSSLKPRPGSRVGNRQARNEKAWPHEAVSKLGGMQLAKLVTT